MENEILKKFTDKLNTIIHNNNITNAFELIEHLKKKVTELYILDFVDDLFEVVRLDLKYCNPALIRINQYLDRVDCHYEFCDMKKVGEKSLLLVCYPSKDEILVDYNNDFTNVTFSNDSWKNKELKNAVLLREVIWFMKDTKI